MKIEFEKIAPDSGSSFKVIQWKSKNDRFFWHQHPEFEIIYVKKGSGKLHIGNHLGKYRKGELMFLGPNLPHAGLGYGVIGQHEEIIIQLNEGFLGQEFMNAPELEKIKNLFERSVLGLTFHHKTRQLAAEKIEELINLKGLDRLMKLVEVLKLLSETPDFKVLNNANARFDFRHKDENRINKVYQYVENNYKSPIDIEAVAELSNLTLPSFCRYFKKMSHMTFTDFVNEFRVNNACKLLHSDISISEVCFESGFLNVSHFNRTFKKFKGQSPRDYRSGIINK